MKTRTKRISQKMVDFVPLTPSLARVVTEDAEWHRLVARTAGSRTRRRISAFDLHLGYAVLAVPRRPMSRPGGAVLRPLRLGMPG
jgi:hypothetical protein